MMRLSLGFQASALWKTVLWAAFFSAFAPVAQAQTVSAKLMVCAACHGADGNSQLQGAPSLAGQPKVFIENQLVMIREGMRNITMMQGMLDGVSDGEISAMAAHYAALPLKKPPVDRQATLHALGEKKSMRCVVELVICPITWAANKFPGSLVSEKTICCTACGSSSPTRLSGATPSWQHRCMVLVMTT